MIPCKDAEAFFTFMVERESIRVRRLLGRPREQWTQDPVLQLYSFTNVKREHDRTSRTLLEEFYRPHTNRPLRQVLLNCTLARFFGTVEMVRAIGWTEAWSKTRRARIQRTAEARLAQGLKVFTGAYIVPNCGVKLPKHEVVLRIVDGLMQGPVNEHWLSHEKSWQALCEQLCETRGFGSFMAKEVVLDYIMATGWRPHDWQTWTPVGPGARRGAMIVRDGKLGKPNGLSEKDALEVCRTLHAMAMGLSSFRRHWPMEIEGLPAVELDLTDIQFQLCELAKHHRGNSRRMFQPTAEKTP